MVFFWLVVPKQFLQPSHLHRSLHLTPDWKHSQYFFVQLLFLQWHPLEWTHSSVSCFEILSPTVSILGLKASIFLSRVCATWSFLNGLPGVFSHPWQLQSTQGYPLAKQSQYNFKHLLLRQLHFSLLCVGTALSVSIILSTSCSTVLGDWVFQLIDFELLSGVKTFFSSSCFWGLLFFWDLGFSRGIWMVVEELM